MSLLVRQPGLQSLLVDFGRPGSRARGVPLGGAADRAACALGNALVGNDPDAVALEVAFAGPVLEAVQRTACVVFGAPFESHIGGRSLTPGMTFTLEPGDVLTVGGTRVGARAFVCVAGGFASPEVLGSRSALEPVRAGQELACAPSRCDPRGPGREFPFRVGGWSRGPTPPAPRPAGRGETEPSEPSSQLGAPDASPSFPPLPAGRGAGGAGPPRASDPQPGSQAALPLRALDGPQRDWFTDDAFFAQTYTVAPASNRMGLRLLGAPCARRPGELVSEAVAPGAVQVTNDGLPIVLGVDGQTIGGYPKVAHVIRADLDELAQLRPGDHVHFVRVTAAEAEEAARARAEWLRSWLARIRRAERRPVVG